MTNITNVVIKEDKDLNKILNKTAKQLNKKYEKKRKINEKLLKKELSKPKKILLTIVDIFLIIFCILSCIIGIKTCIFRLNKIPPSIAGYSIMSIATDSMQADGFKIGDSVVVRKINPKTLNIGDNIAFYVYNKDYNLFYSSSPELINKQTTKHDYRLNFTNFIGLPSNDIKDAINANSKLIFHQITKIYKDENGVYWFKTKGSTNPTEDSWHVSERMIYGVHSKSKTSAFLENFLNIMTNNLYMIIIVSIPLVLMLILLIIILAKRIQVIKLIQDCVEEKRKITDEICVKNEVGFNMDTKTKLKILAQSSNENRSEYIALLWQNGTTPSNIRKYIIRKQFLLKPIQKILILNRECEKMFAQAYNPKQIAKYYIEQKKKIQKQQAKYTKLLSKLSRQYNTRKKSWEIMKT